ncbi:MAG: tetratricopeptide repeat protein [Myxococcota bacterium]
MSASIDQVTEPSAGWALADRIVQACVEEGVLGEAVHPVVLGRYRVERVLAAGGMGRLLLAHDPDLARPVALKLIHPSHSRSPEARQRIVIEARAMARLSHPNVAQVYEVGEAEGQLFVSMEYIEGQDLRAWLADGPQPWREVLATFREAGAGLAAAHDKAITHRDFKPDNVMLHNDGRPRVIDFGLAHGHDAEPAALSSAAESEPDLQSRLTQTGVRVGTPAYMAPEQWDGSRVDARTDQYAFCVSLFEALTGERPFSGKNEAYLRRAQQEGTLAPWSTAAPRWILRALRRGLQTDPARRWPSMSALLAALDPSRRRQRWTLVGVGVLVAASASAGLAVPSEDPCADAGAGVEQDWGEPQRSAVAQAATIAAPEWGTASAEALALRLDEHVTHFRAAARAVCAATQAEVPTDVTAADACLVRARDRLVGAIDEAVEGDPALWVSAVARAELLADPRGCLEARPAAAAAAEHADDQILAVERSLGEMSVRAGAGSYADALQRGHAAAEATAFATGSDSRRIARAGWTIGRLHLADGEPKPAERHFRRALGAARAAADPGLAAAITVELVYAVARDRERASEAADLADEATGMLAGLGDPPLLGARLDSHRASALAHARDGDHERAVTLHERALAATKDTLGPAHPQTIAVLGNLGAALNYAGRPADAEARLSEAVAAAQKSWGPTHPRTATLLGTLGLSRLRQGDAPGATIHLRRALEIRVASLGTEHAQVDDARYNLATALRRQQEHAEALVLLEPGLLHNRERLGPDDARLGPWWVAVGESALAVGALPRAREALRGALRVFERTGATAGDYARVRLALARAVRDEDPARARVLGQRALADAIEARSARRRAEIDAFLAELPVTAPAQE